MIGKWSGVLLSDSAIVSAQIPTNDREKSCFTSVACKDMTGEGWAWGQNYLMGKDVLCVLLITSFQFRKYNSGTNLLHFEHCSCIRLMLQYAVGCLHLWRRSRKWSTSPCSFLLPSCWRLLPPDLTHSRQFPTSHSPISAGKDFSGWSSSSTEKSQLIIKQLFGWCWSHPICSHVPTEYRGQKRDDLPTPCLCRSCWLQHMDDVLPVTSVFSSNVFTCQCRKWQQRVHKEGLRSACFPLLPISYLSYISVVPSFLSQNYTLQRNLLREKNPFFFLVVFSCFGMINISSNACLLAFALFQHFQYSVCSDLNRCI